MPNILVIVGGLLAAWLVVLFVRSEPAAKRSIVSWIGAAVGIVLAVVLWTNPLLGPWSPPVAGITAGIGVTLALLEFPDSSSNLYLGAPLGLLLVAVGALSTEAVAGSTTAMAVLAGSGAAAALLALNQRGQAAGAFAIVGSGALSSLVLGGTADLADATSVLVNLLVAALLALLAGHGLSKVTFGSKLGWPPVATALGFTGLTLIATLKQSLAPDLPLVACGSALAAVTLSVIAKSGQDHRTSVLTGSLVWLGVATVAFNLCKGYGLAVAGVVAVLAGLIAGERRLLAWLAPLLAMAVYRMVRYLQPDTSKAFDIGQHYVIVGLVLGLLVPGMLVVWARRSGGGDNGRAMFASLGVVFGGLAALAGTSLAVAFLGPKGSSGLVIGLLLSPVASAMGDEPPKSGLPVAVALSLWAAVSLSVMSMSQDMARPEKARLIGLYGLPVLGLAVVAYLLIRFISDRATQTGAA